MRVLVLVVLFIGSPSWGSEQVKVDLAEAILELRQLEREREELDRSIARMKARIENLTTSLEGPTNSSLGRKRVRAPSNPLLLKIARCWNVGALSTDALKVTVTVGFTMTPDAKPETGSIRLVGAEGGSGSAVDRAYEAARRAIIRCGAAGFGLPADKYNQWRGVEVRFNATTKEIR